MPDDDVFATYKDLGVSVHPLPASEVRRRGDRMRRRRTALATVGIVAAVGVLVATPLALVAGGDDSSRPIDPAAPSTVEWRTTVPDDFPLASGMPDGAERSADYAQQVVGPCGGPGFTAEGALDTEDVIWTDGVEASEQRALAVYADDTAAAAALDDVREQLGACEEPSERGDSIAAAEQPSDLGEESFVFVNEWYAAGEPTGEAHVNQLVRVGNAVLYDNANFGGAGDPAVVDLTVAQTREDSAYAVSSMCVFAADPCSEPPAEPGTTEDAPSIPAGFALDAGLAPDGDSQAVGPSADGDGVDLSSMCDTLSSTWPAAPVDRLAYALSGPESLRVRELATYPSPERAAGVLAGVQDAVAACTAAGGTSDGATAWTELEPDGAPPDSVTFAQYQSDGGIGGVVYQLTRVGPAVLATSWAAEWSMRTLEPGVADLTAENAPVVEQMVAAFGD
ncbi:hypothetical protein I601_0275 [Nocardioides dokdonensis FR1436]|uniref:Uncharacterized protein n=1 Tax=Nocardioides dokdonensis FR1436 TaxID=1300347 RepID=A0A1A9GEN3_9ACTN|nr:hypothetical protein [Nocardioides dokdonensis]ANH36728.1 hypothetical protein I601_0275 [Nocardioides dokdonensis FR1436]